MVMEDEPVASIMSCFPCHCRQPYSITREAARATPLLNSLLAAQVTTIIVEFTTLEDANKVIDEGLIWARRGIPV
jgi:hypothetical protein